MIVRIQTAVSVSQAEKIEQRCKEMGWSTYRLMREALDFYFAFSSSKADEEEAEEKASSTDVEETSTTLTEDEIVEKQAAEFSAEVEAEEAAKKEAIKKAFRQATNKLGG